MSENTQNTETTETLPPVVNMDSIGKKASKIETQKVDVLANLPIFAVGDTWLPGRMLAGRYLGTTVAKSDKFIEGKAIYHVFREEGSSLEFGIWDTGLLKRTLSRVRAETYVEITYKGKGDKPFREGEDLPHVFDFNFEAGSGVSPNVENRAPLN